VILDSNNGQIDGAVSQVMPIEPIADKWRAFGWNVIEIDGHDMKQIVQSLDEARSLQNEGVTSPTLILARTIKGKGVSFMENKIEWHGVVPKQDEAARAKAEILKHLDEIGGEKDE
jgi:transketolase